MWAIRLCLRGSFYYPQEIYCTSRGIYCPDREVSLWLEGVWIGRSRFGWGVWIGGSRFGWGSGSGDLVMAGGYGSGGLVMA